ncbi:MFS transporter [Rhodococcus sp. G-MC3]|uniref:MFS transporter n=1 Tax=Rhodococcus sp. G-MC3 TaxID=3046209 RepID=UPI0024B88555|nr:MFS transporter [Rhodococcus sp. G-MC3]MDJ0392481.1 MFS transporter [Rhodococcus sp. G-MC3]
MTDSQRTEGPLQGTLLIAISCLSVLGAVLLSPAQPQILDEFSHQSSATWLVPLVITTPALMVGLLAFGARRIVDAVGRIRLMKISLLMYALFGTAPLYLDSLVSIVASRVGVGIAEAAIMTCATTLIADYFEGRTRARYLGLQVVFSSLSAVVFIGLGGALAQSSWRTPFWLYASGIVFAGSVAVLLWQPSAPTEDQTHPTLQPVQWRPLLAPLTVTLFGGIVFYIPIVEIPYALSNVGVSGSGAIGAVSALAALGTALGAISFGKLGTFGPKRLRRAHSLPQAQASSRSGSHRTPRWWS